MSAKYAVLLGVVVIDATNKTIRFREDATTEDAQIAEGVYFVRGNGGASDLLVALVTALESNTNATNPNTYSVTIAWDTNSANPTAEVTITRASGASSFSILWSHANTTFDPALLGFAREDTAHDGNDKVSTLSPSSLWVSSNVVNRLEPKPVYQRSMEVSRGNVARAVERAHRRDRWWEQSLIHAPRMHEEYNVDDPTATIGRFIRRHADGKRFEFHEADIATGTELEQLTATPFVSGDEDSGTRVGTFLFSDDFYDDAFTVRDRSTPMYDFQGALVAHHLADEDEYVMPAGAVYTFDPNDSGTLTLSGSEIEDANDAEGGDNHLFKSGGVVAFDPTPNRVAGVVNGRAIARFSTSGGFSNAYLRGQDSVSTNFSLGRWFVGVNNASIPGFTRYVPFSLTSARSLSADNDNDVIWGGALYLWNCFVRFNAGDSTYRIRARVSSGGVAYETPEVTLPGTATWCVIAVRCDSSTLELRVDDGPWSSVAVPGAVDGNLGQYVGTEGSSGRGFDGDIAMLVDYAAAHTDAEANQALAFLRAEVLGE